MLPLLLDECTLEELVILKPVPGAAAVVVARADLNHFIEVEVGNGFVGKPEDQRGIVHFPGVSLNAFGIKPQLFVAINARKLMLFLLTVGPGITVNLVIIKLTLLGKLAG